MAPDAQKSVCEVRKLFWVGRFFLGGPNTHDQSSKLSSGHQRAKKKIWSASIYGLSTKFAKTCKTAFFLPHFGPTFENIAPRRFFVCSPKYVITY